ncbi:MAG TPA: alkaline phosphatase family protein [Actinomycetota bacterium]|nr:alkaline phosphatase family protein [Actinomycetota bacterium]
MIVTNSSRPDSVAGRLDVADRTYPTNDPVSRACDLPEVQLLRVWRGSVAGRSPDIVMVPQYPNYTGAFDLVNHSGPWDYLTTVPLVVYGSHVPATGAVDRPVDLVDVYPTVGELLHLDFEARDGTPLTEAIEPGAPAPKLVVTVVWDGAGANVLDRWRGRWPFLASLERDGVSYTDASTGSSPTITPATHSTLGTGYYPRDHGVAGIYYRDENGAVTDAFHDGDPGLLRASTYGDDVDSAFGQGSKVGLVGWRTWHLGMIGHGAATPGADHDQVALFRHEVVTDRDRSQFTTAPDYSLPGSLEDNTWSRLPEYAQRIDRADGRVDDRWRTHPVLTPGFPDNPAWADDETDAVIQMLRGEDYGRDATPDLFFVNFKMADTVGHHYLMDSPEMGDVIAAMDGGLRRIVGYLDDAVGDYALILTADHGHTPPPEQTGAWPILIGQLAADVDKHFEVPEGQSLIDGNVGVGLFLDHDEMADLGVSATDVARFVNSYTVADNWTDADLPAGYEERAREQVFAAAWPEAAMDEVMRCRFGALEPPADLHG